MSSRETLLGLGGYVERAEVEELIASLRRSWEATIGSVPGELDADLEESRRWFDPVAQGQRLRRELAALRPFPVDLRDPGSPLTFRVDAQRWLVTPEGRCALHLLESLPAERPGHTIGDEQTAPYERRLAILYREWGRHRLRSVVALLQGTTKPLQVPAAGVVVALLVNRCTSEDRALTRFASGTPRDIVDRAFFAAVQAFADILAPSRRRSARSAQLVSGWMLYEARRRLGDGLVVEDARGGDDGSVWIRPESIDDIIETIARDIVRGHRRRATPELFGAAYDSLVTELRGQLPALAGFGLVHERPIETRKLRERLVGQVAHYHLEST